jgi:hypothetical protein
MATTYTSNTKLGKPATGDTGWDTVLNATVDQLETLASLSGGCVTPAEVPSTTLNVRVGSLNYLLSDGTVGTYAGSTSFALTASNTNYVYLDSSFALTKSTSSFPATAHIRLATVVAGGSTITSVTDSRVFLEVPVQLAGITFGDAANLAFGTTTGTKLGTATTQKLAFYNSTPIAQRSGAAQAAVATTGATNTTPYGFTTSAQADAIVTLVNELRAALVALGLVKGSA